MFSSTQEEIDPLYTVIHVVRRAADQVVVYRCLQHLQDATYFVQSADRIRAPVGPEDLRALEVQFWELLLEESPDRRLAPRNTWNGSQTGMPSARIVRSEELRPGSVEATRRTLGRLRRAEGGKGAGA
jgi:hypothetical protein